MKVTKRQAKEIQALQRLRDEEIDLTDIPQLRDWDRAEVGKFYRPIKKSLTIRLDADVLAWLRGQGRGYQTRINALLREKMDRQVSESRVSEFGRWDLSKEIVAKKLSLNNLSLEYFETAKWAAMLADEPTEQERRGVLSVH
jgi:uncharacterized protein (DUF4415 family)